LTLNQLKTKPISCTDSFGDMAHKYWVINVLKIGFIFYTTDAKQAVGYKLRGLYQSVQ